MCLCATHGLYLILESRELLSSCGAWVLIVMASLVAEHRLGAQVSVVVAYGLSSCDLLAIGGTSFSSCGTWAHFLQLEGSIAQTQ